MALFLRSLKKRPQNILIARTDRIGDFVLTLPVFSAIQNQLGMEFSVLCQESVTPLLKNNPDTKSIITVSENLDELAEEIKKHQFDALVVLVNDRFIRRLLPKLKFIPVRIGPLNKASALFAYTHPVIQKRSKSICNEAEYNLELLKIFGQSEISGSRPQLYFANEEIEALRSRLPKLLESSSLPKTFTILHQGMGGSALNWKQTSYFSLLSMILKQGHSVIMTGTGKEEVQQNRKFSDQLKGDYPNQLFDITNKISLRELAILIHLGNLFIGPSTGPTHIANAAGTSIISFYPPIQVQSTKRWEPYLGISALFTPDVPCGQKFRCIGEKCRDYYCMDLITPEAVFETYLQMVGDGEEVK